MNILVDVYFANKILLNLIDAYLIEFNYVKGIGGQ